MRIVSLLIVASLVGAAFAQPGVFGKEELINYTPEWHGERFAEGRPKVPDAVIKRMKYVTFEEAWDVLREAGFAHQYRCSKFFPAQPPTSRAGAG